MLEGPILLVILVIAIVLVVLATSKLNLHPFLALLVISYLVGLSTGLPSADVVGAIGSGFGNTLGSIGIIIVAGTIIGKILSKTGAAVTLANTMLRLVGMKRAPLAMSATGYLTSTLVFCDSGFVILNPLNRALSAKANVPMATMAVVLATGLYSTHCLVPPAAGPIASAGIIGVEPGKVMLLGFLVAIPAALAGLLWGTKFSRRYKTNMDEGKEVESAEVTYEKLPGVIKSFAPILAPIGLIALSSIASFPSAPFGGGWFVSLAKFIGHPITALLIGVGIALFLLPRWNEETLQGWIGEGIQQAAVILAITGAGGCFGTVLKATPIGDYLGQTLAGFNLGIFLPFIISAALKTAQGSSTVAIITASSLAAPLLPSLGLASGWGPALAVLAIGGGAMTVSHANDSYFWVVSQFSGFSVANAYRAYTTATLVVGCVTILSVFILSLILL